MTKGTYCARGGVRSVSLLKVARCAAFSSVTLLMLLALLAPRQAQAAISGTVNQDPVYCGATTFGNLCVEGIITPTPLWRVYGSPQLVGVGAYSCFNAAAFCPGALSTVDEASLTLRGLGSYFAFVTNLGVSNGIIGSDVSVPNAYWLRPKAYVWSDPNGPYGGGGASFFNSLGTLNGRPTFFANFVMVLDPPSISPIDGLIGLNSVLGGIDGTSYLTSPTQIPLSDLTDNGNTSGNISGIDPPGFGQTPEPSFLLLLAGMMVALAVFRWRRRAA